MNNDSLMPIIKKLKILNNNNCYKFAKLYAHILAVCSIISFVVFFFVAIISNYGYFVLFLAYVGIGIGSLIAGFGSSAILYCIAAIAESATTKDVAAEDPASP